jgi:hypothetical protein
MDVFELALWSLPLLLFVQFNTLLPSWGSRKVLHMGTGTLLMMCDVRDPLFRYATYAVTTVVVAFVWHRSLHFFAVKDVGIINYLLFCSLCVSLQLPLVYCAPLFYADPMGAIVGRNVDTPKLVGTKSVGGTLAVFVTAALTLVETAWPLRLASAAMIALLELFAGKWDNPAIGVYLLAHHALLR